MPTATQDQVHRPSLMNSATLAALPVLLFGFACPILYAAGDDLPPLSLRLPAEAPAKVRDAQNRIYQVAQKQAHYLLSIVHPWSADASLRLLTESKSTENWIRPNAGAVEGFAFLHRFGPYDERLVGVARAELLTNTLLPMMRYLVATHVTGPRATSDGKRWGDAWQSAHWAQMLGRGAWFIWAGLPADLRAGVRHVVAHEADRIAGSEPPHQLRADTKAEENAWNSQVLSVAVLLLPDDARRAGWETAYQKWAMSSFLRPADEHNHARVDGKPVREQFTGANIFDDFTLENHNFVHPDYMTTFSLLLNCAPDFALTGRRPPEAMFFNVAPIYENCKWLLLPEGGFVYPNGQDWELFRNPAWLNKHVLMSVWMQEPEAWSWVGRLLELTERMQTRSANGAVFHPAEYFFASTQTDLFRSLANAWLSLQLAGEIPEAPRERMGVRHWDSAKVILHRTPTAIHTVSWGAKIMAQCVPFRWDRLVSPHERNGLGHIRLDGARGPLPLRLQEVHVQESTNGFTVRLAVDHGPAVRAQLTFHSAADGAFTLTEKLTALTNCMTAEIATGLIGILNNPHWIYERGRRQLAAHHQTLEVVAHSGSEWTWDNLRRLEVDGLLRLSADRPLRAAYFAAKQAERGRATDRLVLNHLPGQRAWTPGAVISEYTVTVRCAGRDR